MDEFSKTIHNFDLTVQGNSVRNYVSSTKDYCTTTRQSKPLDLLPSYYRSPQKTGNYSTKPSSSTWTYESGSSDITSNKPTCLSNKLGQLDISKDENFEKPILNGYYSDPYRLGKHIDTRGVSEADESSNNSSALRWSNNIRVSPSHLASSTSSSSNHVSLKGGIVGLNNLGNTCFMNSIIQCLSNTAPLTEYCLEDRYLKDLNKSSTMNGNLFRSYAELMKELWNPDSSNSSTSPSRFKSQVQRFAPRFMGYSQQDSQEFLRYVLEGLHMEVNRVQKRPSFAKPDYEAEDRLPDIEKANLYWKRYLSMDNSEIVDLFVGQLMSTLECTDCSFKSTTFDPFWDLSLPIPKKNNVNILDCMNLFTSKEELDGNERPICGRCKTRKRCTKSFSIQKFPKILVLHLKRFSGERFRSKMSVMVDYPINNLDLSEFAALSCTQRYAQYKLYAVSNHSGSVYTGHYTASCLHPYLGTWFTYNDSHVNPISERSVVCPEGYVLFYALVR